MFVRVLWDKNKMHFGEPEDAADEVEDELKWFRNWWIAIVFGSLTETLSTDWLPESLHVSPSSSWSLLHLPLSIPAFWWVFSRPLLLFLLNNLFHILITNWNTEVSKISKQLEYIHYLPVQDANLEGVVCTHCRNRIPNIVHKWNSFSTTQYHIQQSLCSGLRRSRSLAFLAFRREAMK